MSIHEISEGTKRVVDMAGLVSASTASAVAALTANQLAVYFTILTCILSSIWYAVRLYDRFARGKRDE